MGDERRRVMSYSHPGLFYLLTLTAVLFFIAGAINFVYLVRLGRRHSPESLRTEGVPVLAILSRVILQIQLFKQSKIRWVMHLAIYWGFGALFLETLTLTVLQWLVPRDNSVSVFLLHSWGRLIMDFWGDFWGLVMALGLVVALLRRYLFPSKQIETLLQDSIILWFLLVIVLTGFLTEGVRIGLSGKMESAGYSFIGIWFVQFSHWLGIKDPMLMFWVHGVISLGLIAYLPFSKLLHIFTAPVEIILSTAGERTKDTTQKRGHRHGVGQTAGLE